MQVLVKPDRIEVDGGRLVVTSPDKDEYYVRAEGFATIETNSLEKPPRQTVQTDPHFYKNGHNYLPLSDSVDRALDTVEDMYEREYGTYNVFSDGGDYDDLREAIEAVIADYQTEGRTSVYKIAGGVIAGKRQGKYDGVPFTFVFKGLVTGKIPTPKPTEGTIAEAIRTQPFAGLSFSR